MRMVEDNDDGYPIMDRDRVGWRMGDRLTLAMPTRYPKDASKLQVELQTLCVKGPSNQVTLDT
jgi:hypothetical protein